jgi:pectin methylesterase-like acyl-CoA thioesterase
MAGETCAARVDAAGALGRAWRGEVEINGQSRIRQCEIDAQGADAVLAQNANTFAA